MTRFAKWATSLALALTAASAAPAAATFPGADGRISFTGPVGEILAGDPDGTDVVELTDSGDGIAINSDWSPDGSRVAFDTDASLTSVEVWTVAADGTDQRPLTASDGGFQAEPAWAPSGTSLAIEADWGDPADHGIWIVPATDPGGGDGVSRDEATKVIGRVGRAGFVSEPQFSPDGEWIAFTGFRACHGESRGRLPFQPHGCDSAIFRVGTDGSGLKRLTPWGNQSSYPDWSPDGEWIAFDSDDPQGIGSSPDIYAMRPDGSRRHRIVTGSPTTLAGRDSRQNPSYAPGGDGLVYTHFTPGASALVVDGVATFGDDRPNRADWGTAPTIR